MENFKNGDDSAGAVKTARFVSLNYMNYNTPTTGNKDVQGILFGNFGTTIGNIKGGTDETSYIGGKWNTQQCVSKATNQDVICDGVTNNDTTGYSPAACCCVAYSTPGTKPGDWYLPMPGELYQIYANKAAINEKRTAIKGSGFSERYYYLSSRENSSNEEYAVILNNGYVGIYSYRKYYGGCVLGFLAVELPAEKYPVNMSPVKLDSSSTKKTPAVADVLYSTADGRLTLDAQTNSVDNTPIAICVIPEVTENFKNGDNSEGAVKTARFVSLNYMNYTTPTTGSNNTQYMYFGNYGTTIGNVKGGTGKTAYIGGKWNTQKCLHACTKENKDLTNGVTNNSGTGYCAPACCCVAYSTPGTKPGDWYLPMPGELYQIYANKTAINEKRTAIKGSGFNFIETDYWSSREYSSDSEYRVYLDEGNFGGDYKYSSYYVLGFLALEL